MNSDLLPIRYTLGRLTSRFAFTASFLAACHFAASATMDTSFGDNGVSTVQLDGSSYGRAISIRPDGRIVVAGTAHSDRDSVDFIVFTYRPDGSFDDSFGKEGLVRIPNRSAATITEPGLAMALQSDGKILVAGATDRRGSPGKNVAVVRFHKSGQLDKEFGRNGGVSVPVGPDGSLDSAHALALQRDGKIIVGGETALRGDKGINRTILALRLNADGSVDESFGKKGRFLHEVVGNSSCRDVRVTSDGKLLLGGWIAEGESPNMSAPSMAVVCLTPSGAVDTSYGNRGVLEIDLIMRGAFHLLDDNRLIVAGSKRSGRDNLVVVKQYLPSGKPDPSVSGDEGLAVGGSGGCTVSWIVPNSSNDGYCVGGHDGKGFLVRFDLKGSPVKDFGVKGFLSTPFTSVNSRENRGFVQEDGKIVITGAIEEGGSRRASTIRFFQN